MNDMVPHSLESVRPVRLKPADVMLV